MAKFAYFLIKIYIEKKDVKVYPKCFKFCIILENGEKLSTLEILFHPPPPHISIKIKRSKGCMSRNF